MIPKSTAYSLVLDGVVIANGSAKAMRQLQKKTPGSRVWVMSAAVGTVVCR